jgi:transposase-like protein
MATEPATLDDEPRAAPSALLLGDVRDARRPVAGCCPHCGRRPLVRWGHFSGRQRYRCRACGRTSSDLTATPLYYSKRLVLWPAYAECVLASLSVRAAARRIGVSKDTAWRWRHRLLRAWARGHVRSVRGRVETVERRLPVVDAESSRPRRGSAPAMRPVRGERVLLARDERGATAWWLTGRLGANSRAYDRLLGRQAEEIAVVFGAGGVASVAASFALTRGLAYGRCGPWPDPAAGVVAPGIDVRGYAWRLRRWMRRFRGVAARYLDTYMYWHRLLDAPEPPARRLLLEAQRSPPFLARGAKLAMAGELAELG